MRDSLGRDKAIDHTRRTLFDCVDIASKGVDSGSGASMASGRLVRIEGWEGLRIQMARCECEKSGRLLGKVIAECARRRELDFDCRGEVMHVLG